MILSREEFDRQLEARTVTGILSKSHNDLLATIEALAEALERYDTDSAFVPAHHSEIAKTLRKKGWLK